jgi:predicted PurR-regulated permease PerM
MEPQRAEKGSQKGNESNLLRLVVGRWQFWLILFVLFCFLVVVSLDRGLEGSGVHEEPLPKTNGIFLTAPNNPQSLENVSDFRSALEDGLGGIGAWIVEWLDLVILLVVVGFIIGIFVRLGKEFFR